LTGQRASVYMLIAMLTTAGQLSGQPRWIRDVLGDTSSPAVYRSASEIRLYESRAVRIDAEGHARTHVRLLTKLLKKPAPGVMYSMLKEFETGRTSVKNIRGWLITGTAVKNELKDEDIVRIGSSPMQESFSEGHIVLAGLRDAGFGDVVGYEYDIEDDEPYASYVHYTFQKQEPVRYSEFTYEIPEGWEVHTSEWNMERVGFDRTGRRLTWTTRDLPFRTCVDFLPVVVYHEVPPFSILTDCRTGRRMRFTVPQ